MRTDSYNWFFRVTLLLGLFALVVTSGCGPTRKQYAINEALLIDQARMLEDEIYRTRYELHRTLSENQRLKEELTKSDGQSGSRRSRESREPAPASSDVPFEPVSPPTPETAAKVNAPQKILVIPTGSSQPAMVESLPQAVVVPRSATRENTNRPIPASGTSDFPMLPMIPAVPVSQSGVENADPNSHLILPGVVPLNRPTPASVPLGNVVPPIYQPADSNSPTSRPMSYLEERPRTTTKIDSDWSPLEEQQ